MTAVDRHVVNGKLRVPYNNWHGALASDFFRELRDHQRLRGTRCPACDKVYMPPRAVCPDCLARLTEWIDLPLTGTILSYTIVQYDYGAYYQPEKAPYPIGIIRLDGADTGLCHLLGEVRPEDIRMGMRVEAVFRNERKGNILDIAYFRPL